MVVVDIQGQVAGVVDGLIRSGAERGVQVAAYLRGEQVVDVAAGTADARTGRPVRSDTPFYNYSIGKGTTSTVVHMLVGRGLFGYDTRVAELWPAFGAHGKDRVTVRHVLTHSAGVPAVPPDTTPEDLCDWDRMCAAIADLQPWWEPGTRVGYHAWTFGYIAGEVVRRATGTPISQVLRAEISGPLGVTGELYFGVPAAEQDRLARLEDDPESPMPQPPPGSPAAKAAPPALRPTAELGNRTDILAADIPATAKTSARAMARMYAALLGEVDGVRLVPRSRLREVTAIAAEGTDEVFGNPSTWALGYAIGLPDGEGGDRTTFGMGGAGGSFAFADTTTGLACTVTRNRLSADFATAARLCRLVAGSVR